ncbi:MAG: hypothetical protein H0X64_10840 [Gemmatimonadaceae bacterium]|nr:hypothetical protein [Gemmatimonadaceae bacterium]
MERRQKQVLESYERVQAFVEAHPLEGGASYGAPKALLDEVVARLGSHGTMQETGGRMERGEMVKQRLFARQLREGHLRPIAQVGRAVLSHVPQIDALVRTPSPHLPARMLVIKAQAVRGLAAAHEEVLATNGCEEDFLAQLDEAIAVLSSALTGRALSTGTRVGSRQGLANEIRRGRDAVQMLDAIVRRRFGARPETLAAWRVARRVRLLPGGMATVASGGPEAGTLPLEAA